MFCKKRLFLKVSQRTANLSKKTPTRVFSVNFAKLFQGTPLDHCLYIQTKYPNKISTTKFKKTLNSFSKHGFLRRTLPPLSPAKMFLPIQVSIVLAWNITHVYRGYNSGTCKKYVEILLSSGGEEMHVVKNTVKTRLKYIKK